MYNRVERDGQCLSSILATARMLLQALLRLSPTGELASDGFDAFGAADEIVDERTDEGCQQDD